MQPTQSNHSAYILVTRRHISPFVYRYLRIGIGHGDFNLYEVKRQPTEFRPRPRDSALEVRCKEG